MKSHLSYNTRSYPFLLVALLQDVLNPVSSGWGFLRQTQHLHAGFALFGGGRPCAMNENLSSSYDV